MINIEKIYNILIEGKELTTKELNNIGFTSKDLTKLENDGILKRIKIGFYALSNVDDLYFYGKKLISLKQYNKATICFEKCYEIEPNHSETNFQLFLRNVINKEYEKAFKNLDVLLSIDNDYYKKDVLFYLYMLSVITEIPDRYKDMILFLNYYDIKIDSSDKRFKDIDLQNNMRLSAFNQNFSLALKQCNEYMTKSSKIVATDFLTKKLLASANEVFLENNKIILELTKLKNYKEIIRILQEREQKHFYLSEYECNVLILSNLLLKLENGDKINKTDFVTNKIYYAIKMENYELALKLCIQKNEKIGANKDDNVIYLLLVEVNNLMEKVNNTSIKKEELDKSKIPVTEELINYALKEILNNNLYNAFRAIYAYLSMINRSEYEFLIVNLIKLDLIQKDYTFNRTLNVLSKLSNNEYYFDENKYIKYLYECLEENKLEEANIYLSIVSNGNTNLKELEFETKKEKDKFYRKLAISRITMATKVLGTNYSKFMDTVKKNNYLVGENELGDLVVTNPNQFIKLVNGSFFKHRKIDSNTSLIESKINELKQNNGFVILGKMNEEKINVIKDIIRRIPDVAYFIVGTGETKTVALKNRKHKNVYIKFNAIIQESQLAYYSGEYEKCINLQKELLAFGRPKANVFARIGLAYMKLGQNENAIKYLSMATQLSIQEQSKYDFTELIDNLSGKTYKNDCKSFITRKIKMTEQDFIKTENYGITNFDEINSLILSGISINEACKQFNLTEEQINIVKLLIARNYYIQEDYITGDAIIKNVEKSKYKTPFIIELINMLRKNKKLYKNRKTDDNIYVKKISL